MRARSERGHAGGTEGPKRPPAKDHGRTGPQRRTQVESARPSEDQPDPNRLLCFEGDLVFLLVGGNLLDFRIGEGTRGTHGDRLLLTRCEISCGNADNPVGVDIEAHLNLGLTLRRRSNPGENELAQKIIFCGDLALPLEHTDFDAGLIISCRRENMSLRHRNRRIAFNQSSEVTAIGRNPQRKWRDVEKQDIVRVVDQSCALNSGIQSRRT